MNPQKVQLEQTSRTLSALAPSLNLKTPSNASKTVYVEGLPCNTGEREVAHLFRPFPGYKQLRLIPRESKDGQKVYLCFADFEEVD